MCIRHAAQGWCSIKSCSAECQHWPCCCSPGSPCLLCSLSGTSQESPWHKSCVIQMLRWGMCKWMDFASPRKGASRKHLSHSSWFSHQVKFVISCQHRLAKIGTDKTAKYALMVVLNKKNSSHLTAGLCPLPKVVTGPSLSVFLTVILSD